MIPSKHRQHALAKVAFSADIIIETNNLLNLKRDYKKLKPK